ncbi:alanine racemase [Rubrivirga sp. IMCC43871]|uniref:alanine racemase n=1 Tax=Rubrivirga sp. IMCC43871 TaxID=3391575 RepID=UPI00398FD1B6
MLVSDLPTPALLVDRARLHANLDAMAARADAQSVALRPHVKTHKSPAIATMQVDRGARGLTVATVDEAEAFAETGFQDIRLASPVVGPTKLDRLAALASTGTRISFTVDSARGVALASAAFSAAGASAEVLLEVDGGYGRCGVAYDDLPLAIDIAGRAAAADGLRLVGVLSHGGDAYAADGDDARRLAMDTERDRTLTAAQALVDAGLLDAATAEVSVGSTPGATVFTNAPEGGLRVTEIRPGTYALMDRMQVALGAASLLDCALVCVSTVVSKKRFDDGTERVITDAGKKALTSDLAPGMDTFGEVLYSPRTMIAHPHAVVSALSEEHGWVDTPGGAIWDVADPVFVVPNHACVAVATRRQLYLVDGDEVVETLDVVAR